MKISNMTSNNGNTIANQFIVSGVPAGIYNKEGVKIASGSMFQSYESIIAFQDYMGKVYLDAHYWDYSKTTGKYRNQFLGESKKETQAKIDSGEYTLVHFND